MSTKRLFFGLWPDDRQRDQLRNAISPVAKLVEGSAVYRGEWHVTLAFVGDFEIRRIPELWLAMQAIQVEPFRLRFDRAEFWPRPKVAVLVAQTVPSELENLVASLNSILTDAGMLVEEQRFRPHITIVRRARPFETQRLAQPVTVEWSGFELIESVLDRGSRSYYPLKQ